MYNNNKLEETINAVEFKIEAEGYGVINWNGPTTLAQEDGMTYENHTLPKLRSYSPLTGKVKEENGYCYRKQPVDISFKKTPMYVGSNCIKFHLFKEHAYDFNYIKSNESIKEILKSLTGLFRGYVVASSQCKRKSCLLLEDFIEQLGNGNFEQFSKFGEKTKNSLFSKTTFGETSYICYGSISVEDLQFISLDHKFDRAALIPNSIEESEELAINITDFIKSLDKDTKLEPKATFNENYIRSGSIFKQGEAGILLNQDALTILIESMLQKINDLTIKQGGGYLYVKNLIVDYNNSNEMMRIKRNPTVVVSDKNNKKFTEYYFNE